MMGLSPEAKVRLKEIIETHFSHHVLDTCICSKPLCSQISTMSQVEA